MPFRKTNRKPRARRNRTLAKRVAHIERNSRPEVKHISDESGAFDTVGSITGTLIKPQMLAQGTGRQARIGDKVKSRNIRFQAIFKMPSLATNPTCALRVLVLRSKFTDPLTGDMPSWYGTVDQDKFFVVKDILTQVSQAGNRTGSTSATYNIGSTLKKIKFNLPTGLRKLQYDGSSNQSPMNNEYVVYLLAENQSAEVAYNWQHYYIDN